MLSASGPERTISRLKAALQSNAKIVMVPEDLPAPFYRWNYQPVKSDAGYVVHRQKLDYDTWHLLAVSRFEGLMPAVSEEALWQELRSERYTTPLLKRWLPWLQGRLIQENLLRPLDCFQCQAACLSGGTAVRLDELVSEGISEGHLEIV